MRSLLLFLLFATSAAAQGLLGIGGDSPLRLGVSPKNGSTHTGTVEIGGSIDDGPDGRFTVVIKCFGVTHHHLTPERISLLGIKTTTGFSDNLFNQTPGQHTAQVSVWQPNNPKPLAEATVTFTIVKPDTIESQALDDIRRDLASYARSVLNNQKSLLSASRDARSGKKTTAQLAESEDYLRKRRLDDRYARANALIRTAELYERALDPARALRALQLAQKIHADESGAGEPFHLEAFARYHTRRGDYEKTLDCWKQIIAWHESQPQPNRNALSRAYESLGQVHILFKNDLDACRACEQKAAQLRK